MTRYDREVLAEVITSLVGAAQAEVVVLAYEERIRVIQRDKRALGQYQREPLPPIAMDILERLRLGQPVPTGSSDRQVRNALTRLRRRGLIINKGTRRQPKWELVS